MLCWEHDARQCSLGKVVVQGFDVALSHMKQHASFKFASAVLSLCAWLFPCAVCHAAGPSATGGKTPAPTAEASGAELGLLENRFFSRQYLSDPLEKRLERLELLVFASTQEGSPRERLARLKNTLGARSGGPAAKAASQAAKSPPKGSSLENMDSSSQYPVLNTLEWRALKKTYSGESLDQRLERIESKLFGQPSPSMAYVDRVERLKRTLGIGLTTQAPLSSMPTGPMPKARQRSQMLQDHFGWSTPGPSGEIPPAMPDLPDYPSDQAFGADISRTFAEMFKDMNRQMQELNKMGPGQQWTFDPQTGTWSHRQFKGDLKPAQPGQPGAQPRLILPASPPPSDIPPYADPNSI